MCVCSTVFKENICRADDDDANGTADDVDGDHDCCLFLVFVCFLQH